MKPHVKLALREFKVFRKDRDGRGGGVGAFVRKHIPARQVALDGELEAGADEVELSESIERFISVYLPPKKVLYEVDFRKRIEHPNIIIGGDWNAKNKNWSCRSDNQNGRTLAFIIRSTTGLKIYVPED